MSPDDKRHGSVAGYRAGCTDECCRRAVNRYNQLRKLARDRGKRHVPVDGTRRRVQALAALGWSHAYVAERMGRNATFLAATIRENRRIHISTAARVALIYDQLSMRLPPEITAADRMSVTRTRRLAERRGWPAPLAWNDDEIDDPNARPRGVASLGHIRTRKADHEAAECPRCGVRRQVRTTAKRALCPDCRGYAQEEAS